MFVNSIWCGYTRRPGLVFGSAAPTAARGRYTCWAPVRIPLRGTTTLTKYGGTEQRPSVFATEHEYLLVRRTRLENLQCLSPDKHQHFIGSRIFWTPRPTIHHRFRCGRGVQEPGILPPELPAPSPLTPTGRPIPTQSLPPDSRYPPQKRAGMFLEEVKDPPA